MITEGDVSRTTAEPTRAAVFVVAVALRGTAEVAARGRKMNGWAAFTSTMSEISGNSVLKADKVELDSS